MNIHLTPELVTLIEHKVASGGYASSSEVVREALRQMLERDRFQGLKLQALREEIARGLAQADAGDTMPFDHAAAEDVIRRGRERRTARRAHRKS